MEAHLPDWLWPIALCGGLGAFLDFLIGRAGQDRARRYLETWWIRFDDVQWKNFGRNEALFAVGLMDRWCGKHLFSFRRLLCIIVFLVTAFFIGELLALFGGETGTDLRLPVVYAHWPSLSISALGLATSLSFTRLVSTIVARLSDDNVWRNSFTFIAFMFVNYVILIVWFPITQAPVTLMAALLGGDSLSLFIYVAKRTMKSGYLLESYYDYFFEPDFPSLSPFDKMEQIWNELFGELELAPVSEDYAANFTSHCAGNVTNLVRMIIAIISVGSFLVRPLLMRPLSLIWRRIVESDKPVFTLVFGGLGGLVTTANELMKHL